MVESDDDARDVQPRYEPEREVRHAVVMYGGVSLAIYMYGIAEELRHLVCATAADVEDPTRLRAPESTEAVYRDVARALSGGEVKTRFVVDIIAGTSAGGINGICLAKALARDAPIEGLKDVWLKEGDIAALLNDIESEFERNPDGRRGAAIAGLAYADPPASLLSGRRMQRTLVQALAGITRGPDDGSPSLLVDELDLWVTSTDLEGLPVRLRLSNATAQERRHANRYHFRYAPTSEDRDDFGEDANAFLAYAARSTSAFPFAFEPAVLDKLEPFADVAGGWPDAKRRWEKFHRLYNAARPEFAARAFSDGGILDNKPFSYVTESLLTRRARMPVERKLLYIEPDPAQLSPEAPPRDAWKAFQTARAATLQIPRVETIREDIEAILARNREIERLRDIMSEIGLADAERKHMQAVTEARAPGVWADRTLADEMQDGAGGPTYGVYYRLKVRSVVDWLASVLLLAARLDPRSDEALAVHQLVRAWKRRHYSETASATEEGAPRRSENAFLLAYDLPYRMRRLDFLAQKFKELTGPDAERAFRGAGVDPPPGDPAADGQAHAAMREAIDEARGKLAEAERTLVSQLSERVEKLGLTTERVKDILAGNDDAAMLERASEIVDGHRAEFDAVTDVIAAQVKIAGDNARQHLDAALPRSTPVGAALGVFYDTFETYDLALYPLVFGTALGEANPVDIVRISPRDARGPLKRPRERLKGAGLHHFGAFLDQEWRSYDMVWGRLDAAECLIGALLGPDHDDDERDALVRRAHERIIAEYADSHGIAEANASSWFEQYQPPKTPDETATFTALTRARRVFGKLLVDALGKSDASRIAAPLIDTVFGDASPLKTIVALGRRRWIVVVVAVPVGSFAAGLALVLLVDEASWLGGLLMGAAGAPVLIGSAALVLGPRWLRGRVQEAMRNAVFPPA